MGSFHEVTKRQWRHVCTNSSTSLHQFKRTTVPLSYVRFLFYNASSSAFSSSIMVSSSIVNITTEDREVCNRPTTPMIIIVIPLLLLYGTATNTRLSRRRFSPNEYSAHGSFNDSPTYVSKGEYLADD